ncbi:MAG: hypothetical protein CMH22_06375 [Methylophaga sp.]|nr:hypothetical protein [Methylophaga sp.]MAX51589.1 hypothetical protein [Methylophaga sp.]|tara:strand:- start:14953 stop:15486 length:534 start_codon:yes stop_codon:yes gene_type:complete
MDKNKIIVDFLVIPTNEPKYLVISDASYWGRITDTTTIVEIITPGSSKPVVHYFAQGKQNIFNSINLEVSVDEDVKVDLPDGIYQITLKGSPDTYKKTRSYLKTDKIRLDIYKLYLNLSNDVNNWSEEELDYITRIEMLITKSEVFTIENKFKEANITYNQARMLVDEYNKKWESKQ